MELFSEIYSCYYSVVSKILNSAPITGKQMDFLIHTNAFAESSLYLMPKLSRDGSWGLLIEKDGKLCSRLKNMPVLPVTNIEKCWLKSLINDSRIHLFLEENTFLELSEKLRDIKPLYRQEHFRLFDIFNDGDNYSDEKYIKHFKTVLSAIEKRRILNIEFSSGKGQHITGRYLPYRLEYSQKNDKFRVYAALIRGEKTVSLGTINISRIRNITPTEQIYPDSADMTKIFRWKRCDEPITLEISNERNGVERFMMEFAGFEKRTEFYEATEKCIASLWYDKQDETEIIIRILSYGPILKVIGPDKILLQVKERIYRQFDLLFNTK